MYIASSVNDCVGFSIWLFIPNRSSVFRTSLENDRRIDILAFHDGYNVFPPSVLYTSVSNQDKSWIGFEVFPKSKNDRFHTEFF